MNGLRWSIALWALLLAGTHAATQADTVAGSADAAGQAEAPQAPAIKIYKYRDRSGAMSFSDRAPASARYEIIRYSSSCYACNPLSSIDWHGVPLQLNAFRDEIRSAADKYGVDPALVRAVIHAESAFRPRAKSKKGAIGLMQLMPETAKDMGVADVLSPARTSSAGFAISPGCWRKTAATPCWLPPPTTPGPALSSATTASLPTRRPRPM